MRVANYLRCGIICLALGRSAIILAVYTELWLVTEDVEEIGVLAKSRMSMYFTTFESLIVYRNTCRPCLYLKGLIATSFESSEMLHLLTLNGRVGAIST